MKLFNKKGFTLIELLVVIAVLGTLAVVVLIAINPVQQLARARDAGRSSAVAQIGHAVEALATVNNGTYLAENATCVSTTGWITGCLVSAGEIQTAPENSTYSTITAPTCGAGSVEENGWCYDAVASGATSGFVVYARAEAQSNIAKCTTAGTVPYYVYSSGAGRGGIWCGAAAPTSALDGDTTGWVAN